MSVLGPLFIPRKDILKVPKIKDNPELEKYLDDLHRRIHTNELAIERWANTAPRLAAVIGAGTAVTSNSGVVPFPDLPLDGPANISFASMIVGNTIVLPHAGWYTISGITAWNLSTIVGEYAGSISTWALVNGAIFTTSGEFTAIVAGLATGLAPGSAIVVLQNWTPFSITGLFAANDVLSFKAANNISNNPGAGNTNVNANILTLSVDFLGATPSTVQ